jgi:hypothetical protein
MMTSTSTNSTSYNTLQHQDDDDKKHNNDSSPIITSFDNDIDNDNENDTGKIIRNHGLLGRPTPIGCGDCPNNVVLSVSGGNDNDNNNGDHNDTTDGNDQCQEGENLNNDRRAPPQPHHHDDDAGSDTITSTKLTSRAATPTPAPMICKMKDGEGEVTMSAAENNKDGLHKVTRNNHQNDNDDLPTTGKIWNNKDDDNDAWMLQTIPKMVVRAKLSKLRHLVLWKAICPLYLETLFTKYMVPMFEPQVVTYNGGRAKVPQWKISCYLEVMDGGVPTAHPHKSLCVHCLPLLDACNDLFRTWYRQQHCLKKVATATAKDGTTQSALKVKRLMTFITRYNATAPGENALLKHVDGAGKVDGSIVVALPMETDTDDKSFDGHGGGLTFWDGRGTGSAREHHYDTRCGDVALIDRAVWHQANPITQGIRWALVIFYKVTVT